MIANLAAVSAGFGEEGGKGVGLERRPESTNDGEIVTAVLDAGLQLTSLAEHDSAPWAPFEGMVMDEAGEFRLADRPWRLPATFTMTAVKR